MLQIFRLKYRENVFVTNILTHLLISHIHNAEIGCVWGFFNYEKNQQACKTTNVILIFIENGKEKKRYKIHLEILHRKIHMAKVQKQV